PLLRPWGNSAAGGPAPHPLAAGAEGVSWRSWLALLNFKANHRKLLITDAASAIGDGREPLCIVGSANPHDGSSAHSNVALEVRGELARHLFASELDVVRNACADTAVADAMLAPLLAAFPAA